MYKAEMLTHDGIVYDTLSDEGLHKLMLRSFTATDGLSKIRIVDTKTNTIKAYYKPTDPYHRKGKWTKY